MKNCEKNNCKIKYDKVKTQLAKQIPIYDLYFTTSQTAFFSNL
ncbi:hypothetical protein MSIBF_A4510002 [groundwater metagenome]|uniref:Uncharacterized protein n=1 Tax=groundwater metagenome TaxID=717931 RepID=A0A098EDV9_9ZZZZ